MGKMKAEIQTENATRYMRQLCKHWAHRFTAEYDDAQGKVTFSEDQHVEMASNGQQLTLIVTAENNTADELAKVMADHLLRFAHKEDLNVVWQPVEA